MQSWVPDINILIDNRHRQSTTINNEQQPTPTTLIDTRQSNLDNQQLTIAKDR